MDLLTRTEEIVLLAVYQLGDNAYGVTIRKHIEQTIGQTFSVGAIYAPLERLTHRGFLTSYMSEPIAERGGRSRRFYQITPTGISALRETKKQHEAMWAGWSDLEQPNFSSSIIN